MANSPEHPHKGVQSQQKSTAGEAQRRRQYQILSWHTTQLAEAPSPGEILLPFLAAALETCWIDAIFVGLAGFGLFDSRDPLMPLWAPFVIIIASQWALSRLELRSTPAAPGASPPAGGDEQDKGTLPGSSLFVTLVCVFILFVVWISVYAQRAFLFDPRWLLSLMNDVLLLDLRALHIFFIVAITAYLCWRGLRLAQRVSEPSHIFGALRLGMGIMLGVILLRAVEASSGVVFNDDVTLLLLIPIFLFLSLAAHALARVTFVRRMHASGEGDSAPHERAILVTIGLVGVIMLLTALLVDVVASRAMLGATQQLCTILGRFYDWFVNILALVFVVLSTPFFWLLDWWLTLYPPKWPTAVPGSTRAKPSHALPHASSIVPLIVPILRILLPVLLIVFAVLLLRWIVRRRRSRRAVANRRAGELRENLWSWRLFWAQFKALLLALLGRFWPRQASRQERAFIEAGRDEHGARNSREIYRALLRLAATRGYPRKKTETPFEFQRRLNEQTPLAQPHIAPLTGAYTATRYGAVVPDEAEVARIRQEWTQLEQKWSQPQAL